MENHKVKCQMSNVKCCQRGFTLLELLLSLAVIGLIAGVALPVSRSFQIRNDLDIAAVTAVQTMRRAQIRSQGMDNDTTWGVRALSGSITLFRGASYDTPRDISFDEVFDMPTTITPSGVTEFVFAKFTGNPTTTGTLVLTSSDNDVINLTINAKGTITY